MIADVEIILFVMSLTIAGLLLLFVGSMMRVLSKKEMHKHLEAELRCKARMYRRALKGLLSNMEATCCGRAAYGMPVEHEDHPFHESVTKARLVLR